MLTLSFVHTAAPRAAGVCDGLHYSLTVTVYRYRAEDPIKVSPLSCDSRTVYARILAVVRFSTSARISPPTHPRSPRPGIRARNRPPVSHVHMPSRPATHRPRTPTALARCAAGRGTSWAAALPRSRAQAGIQAVVISERGASRALAAPALSPLSSPRSISVYLRNRERDQPRLRERSETNEVLCVCPPELPSTNSR